jgi:LmbE family N-acetylglucosaminyl deacetylase
MSSVTAAAPPVPSAAAGAGPLPRVGSVLVVTARPGQESADLGGLLYAFRRAGTSLALLCLTRGEASPLNATWTARLEAVRPWELQLAANILGISQVMVASYPDGALRRQPGAELTGRIRRAIGEHAADLLLVTDPAAGNPDDSAVAAAACAAAGQAGVPVLARTMAGARGAWPVDLGADAATARAIQKSAAAAHESQSPALPRLVRHLDLLGSREHLRWLAYPSREVPIPESPGRRPSRLVVGHSCNAGGDVADRLSATDGRHQGEAADGSGFAAFARARYMLITTFKPAATPVSSPVQACSTAAAPTFGPGASNSLRVAITSLMPLLPAACPPTLWGVRSLPAL